MTTLNHAISPEDSFEIEKAITYLVANYTESGHNPKPVILHSLRVANLLLEMGYSQDIIIGAVLHDIVEDAAITVDDLEREFGGEIASIVSALSFDTTLTDSVARYKELFSRVKSFGRKAVVIKSVDIAVNSLYINLVNDKKKQGALIEKMSYFLKMTSEFSAESAWQLLDKRKQELAVKL